ncbi:hypothetical protein J437_LFUL005261 [Ladona fulva]|uniref:Uncharacterized protein n=1 Tax=Ladona fulva TaxID=123851 RepID=A0A8K0JW16_LADFU|nr:hypothetical protein J437_LFUL005261 [Ladona fulva]
MEYYDCVSQADFSVNDFMQKSILLIQKGSRTLQYPSNPNQELCHCISLKAGKFPDIWKRSSVVPIFKTGIKTEISNYRPISIQSCISKILNH